KNRARQEKCKDKYSAMSGEICAYMMDVQAVQLVPSLQAGIIYFKQKLACHNFTIYSLSDDKVVCYVWHEGEGGSDANCFASCITDFSQNESIRPGLEKGDLCVTDLKALKYSNNGIHYKLSLNGVRYHREGHGRLAP
ncbi:hypothetical protein ILUMI_14339, partial [Ignelater luminosus]